MYNSIIRISILALTGFMLSACTKQVPKEMLDKQKPQQNQQQNVDKSQMPNDSIHKNIGNNSGDTKSNESGGDKKADEMMKAADDAEAKYMSSKSEADKKEYISKQMGAANYLMFEADLSPKKKYKPALARYNKILEIDPKNSEAMKNKKQIEDIYQSMGMPIPN